MIVGTPTETKDNERRVAVTPIGVAALCQAGHTVLIQSAAGDGSGFSDSEFENAGARIVPTAADAWSADMVIKVKEPLQAEYDFLRDQLLFTYLHLAPEPELTRRMLAAGTTGVAYETVRELNGSLPILIPMSEVAGRMAVQIGAQFLTHVYGGRGTLLGGVPGVAPGRVVVLGAGTVGTYATRIALGMGADVTVVDRNLDRLRQLDLELSGRLTTVASNTAAIAELAASADLLVGAVLVAGGKAPVLVTEAMVRTMPRGSVIVDVAVDQGGCIQTTRPTSHSDPTFVKHGVVHYGVPNIPGAVPRTSTFALSNASLPYALQLANQGPEAAFRSSAALASGVNTYRGAVTNA
ncbi:MAG TPA: alanine dehydrogenase, partial [Chloroflexota bacterium]|nr:alanine dehydrogenase [Chloroflexota bacterium]